MSKKSFIEANRISFSYPSYEGEIPSLVLDGVDVSIEEGEFVAVLGHNGSGKSTLLSIMSGVVKCDKGSFSYDGIDLFKDKKLRSVIIGYVPQGTPLLEELTAYDNLLLWYDRATMKKETAPRSRRKW